MLKLSLHIEIKGRDERKPLLRRYVVGIGVWELYTLRIYGCQVFSVGSRKYAVVVCLQAEKPLVVTSRKSYRVGGKAPELLKMLQDAYWSKFVNETQA